jgi:hypothetical protein
MFSNLKSKNLLLSLALIPSLIISTQIVGQAYSATLSNPQIKNQDIKNQNTIAFRFSSFWQRQPKKPKVVRGGDICPISPGLADTYLIWHSRPLFLWKNRGDDKQALLIVRDRATKELTWKQPVQTADGQALYSGTTALVSGQAYEWKLSGTDDEWKIFQIMSTEEQNKIAAELEQIEQKLKTSKASAEEITQEKAEYFSNYEVKHKTETESFHPWSDVLQTLYEIDKPSPEFAQQRSKYLLNFCKSEEPSAKSNK